MIEGSARIRPGVYPRGEDTRRRILDAAIELFGAEGYEGASTRMLAERAGVNLPAIQYYFGNKEGLYRAAIEHIGTEFGEGMAEGSEGALRVLARDDATRAELLAALTGLIDAFMAMTVGKNRQESRRLFITRAEVEDIAALDSLHEAMTRHVGQPCIALVARLLDRPAEDELVGIRAMSLLGQVLVFCGCKAQRALGWTDIDAAHAALIQSVIHENTEAIIRASIEP